MKNLTDNIIPLLNAQCDRPKAMRPVASSTTRHGKVFVARESKLTVMFQTDEFQTIYNIFVVVLIILSLQTLYDDISSHSLTKALNFELMTWAFGKPSTTALIWSLMFLQTLAVFPLFHYWAFNRLGTSTLYVTLYITYQLFLLAWPCLMALQHHLPPASALVVGCEQLRLIMKIHSFVRENVPMVSSRLRLKDCTDVDLKAIGLDFSNYVYFLFCPTLIYRPSYPRTPKIRWNVVVENFTHVVASLFYTYYIFVRYCVPQFKNTGVDGSDSLVAPFKLKQLLAAAFHSMVPGTVVMLLAFFAILHSWLNAFAGSLRC